MTHEKFFDLTAESLPRRAYSVLILEDDLAFAQLVQTFLESNSFEVQCVTNGADGLRKIMARDFDVIVCDLNMPNLPGDKFHFAVERARNKLARRFIFMTGHASDPRWAGFLAKVSGPVLEKPFTLQELLSTIQTLLTTLELTGE
jgi:DNA-binding response OmpR family regulator